MKKEKPNIYNYVILITIFFVFCLRLIKMDLDVPAWGIVNYQPMDEGQYAMLALNQYNYGVMNPNEVLGEDSFLVGPQFKNNIFGNLFVFIGLRLLGDNYYGLRISSMVFGLINFVLIALNLWNIRKIYGDSTKKTWDTILRYCLLGIMLLDFTYMIACRVVETTIYRMFFVQLIIFLFTIQTDNEFYLKQFRFAVIGFLAAFSVWGVYITNIYVLLTSFCVVVLHGIWNGKRSFVKAFVPFVIGSAGGVGICELYYRLVWKTSCLGNTLETITDFSGATGYTGGSSLRTYITVAAHFFASNENLYNTAIVFLILLCTPFLLWRILKKKDLNMAFSIGLLAVLFLQTCFSEDYIVRKFMMVYPVLLYLLYYTCITMDISKINTISSKKKALVAIYSIMCLVVCIDMVCFRLFFIKSETYLDFEPVERNVVLTQIVFMVIIEIMGLLYLFRGKFKDKTVAMIVGCACCSSIIVNTYFSVKYVFLYDSYTEKEIMQDIGSRAQDDYVYGIYSIAFTLYNDIKPIVNNYEKMSDQIGSRENEWYLDYSEYTFPHEMLQRQDVRWDEERILYRNFQTFGECKDVSLYKLTCME